MKRQAGKKLLTAILLMFVCGLLCACEPVDFITPIPDQGKAVAAEEDAEILLVYRRSNYAWGFYDNGYVIDTQGRVFSYKNGTPRPLDGEGGEIPSLAEYLDTLRENYVTTVVFDEKFVQEIAKLGANLSLEDEFTRADKMMDYGQETIYYFNPETRKLMKCQSTGDVDEMPKNESAKKIIKLLKSQLWVKSRTIEGSGGNTDIPQAYSMAECNLMEIEITDAHNWVGKWFLQSEKELEEFARMSGLRVNEIIDKIPEGTIANKAFFVTVEESGKEKKVRCPKTFWVCGECADFVYDKEKTRDTDYCICRVAVVNGDVLPANPEDMRDLEGNPWTVFVKEKAPIADADSMIIEIAKDEEFVMMRVSDDYVVLPGASRKVYLDRCADDIEIEDGQILRVVADVEIYDGGETGYSRDIIVKKAKKAESVTYGEAVDAMTFPDVEGAQFWYGERVVKYRDGGDIYLLAADGHFVNVYLNGELVLRYEADEAQGVFTPFNIFIKSKKLEQ